MALGSLIHRILRRADAQFGVNILNKDAPSVVNAAQTGEVGALAAVPWGPDTVQTHNRYTPFLDMYCPAVFGPALRDTYPSLKAFIGKDFPSTLKVKRVGVTGAVKATNTTDDVTITAKYPGAVGNLISFEWSVNADTATSRDLEVTITAAGVLTYSATYLAVATATEVTDPNDPYVDVIEGVGYAAAPAVAGPTALTTGADGTAVAADWAGDGGTTPFRGITAFTDVNSSVDVLFAAEVPAAFIDAVNAAKIVVGEATGAHVTLSTPEAQSKTDMVTYVGSYRSGQTSLTWPKVNITNQFDPNLAPVLVDPNVFTAVAIASIDPWNNPAGSPGASVFSQVLSLETGVSAPDYKDLVAAGINGVILDKDMGPTLVGGVVTRTFNPAATKISRERMEYFIGKTVSRFLLFYSGVVLDVNLTKQTLGKISRRIDANIKVFLATLQADDHIKSFNVNWFDGNTEVGLDLDTVVLQVFVETFGTMDNIILEQTVATTVQTGA